MIDSTNHVRINGVSYRLAESAEGQHYDAHEEPLRPPNAVTVQGENSQKFQMRPDLLLWSLTDWSGGEGQIKYDSQAPNRWRELTAVQVFDMPGTLRPGFAALLTDADSDSPLEAGGALVNSGGRLFLIQQNGALDNDRVYAWDDGIEWNNQTFPTSTAGSEGVGQGAADEEFIYWYAEGDIYKRPRATVGNIDPTAMGTSPAVGSAYGMYLCTLGPYLYASDGNGEVVEILKADGTTSVIDDYTEDTDGLASAPDGNILTVAGNKVYLMLTLADKTIVREITPTSAAGPGFGVEIARFQGFRGHAIWSQGGTLFIAGGTRLFGVGVTEVQASLLYLIPGQSYGSLGRIRPGAVGANSSASNFNAQLLKSYFAVTELGLSATGVGVFELDAVSGGFACVSKFTSSSIARELTNMAVFEDDIFISSGTGGAETWKIDHLIAEDTLAEAISPWHDFGISEEKNLSSIALSVEALPANWTVYVDYAINGTDSWTNAITYTTDDGTGTSVAVTTDSNTVAFQEVSLRVRMTCSTAEPTTFPVVRGVDVRAQVVQRVKRWSLLLDAADDGQFTGQEKIENIRTIGSEAVAFLDGYETQVAGQYEEYDVFLDSFNVLLPKPGEGVIRVELSEVA